MTMIMVKKIGVELPDSSIFSHISTKNNGVIGYMIGGGGIVKIKKGFTYSRDVVEELKKYSTLKEAGIVVTFEYTYSNVKGAVSKTQPLPLSSTVSRLLSVDLTCNVGMAHKGILPWAFADTKLGLSDTQVAVRELFSKFKFDDLKNTKYKKLLDTILDTEKAAFLNNTGEIIMFGSWEEDSGTGMIYSDDDYKEPQYASHSPHSRSGVHGTWSTCRECGGWSSLTTYKGKEMCWPCKRKKEEEDKEEDGTRVIEVSTP